MGNNKNKTYFNRKTFNDDDVAFMTIRTNHKTKKTFDDIRRFYGYTQTKFLERLMEYAMDEAVQAGYIPQKEEL